MGDETSNDSSGLVSVEEVLSYLGVAPWSKGKITKEKLSGGLTNDNVLVTIQRDEKKEKKRIVLRRFLSRTSRHLNYDRIQEYHNSCIAFNEKKVGAPVLGFVPSTSLHGGAIALEFVDGKTLNEKGIQSLCSTDSGTSRLVNALKLIHRSPPLFKTFFDPFKARITYEEQVRLLTGKNIAWQNYETLVQQLHPIQQHLSRSSETLVDCHNDLLSANFLDTTSHLTIIDWELSGQAEPSWEIGNFISENGLDDNETAISHLVSQYWSDSSLSPSAVEAKIKRAKLFSIVSKITWAAWGAILHHLDNADAFDYQEWCLERLKKAELALTDQNYIDSLCIDEVFN